MKTCTKCGENKPVDDFHRDKTCKDGRRRDCKKCVNARVRKYEARPDVKSYKARYMAEYYAKNINRILDQQIEYYAKNRNRILDRKSENPHIGWASRYRTRARRYGLEPHVEVFTREDLIERYGDACVDCGGEWSEIDHVIPVRLGGPHTLDNCEPVCGNCNLTRWHSYQREMYEMATHIYAGGTDATE